MVTRGTHVCMYTYMKNSIPAAKRNNYVIQTASKFKTTLMAVCNVNFSI